ncbi:uncharacterized protein Z519_06000 [Cladophialophora bantiana CBS 173.52]|uniref:25S rRNA (Uridine(2843)-N(3))-methyltransferase n=1 Tax=Cladophialophora bantiana (strain ATCC 10958 / CBS 173.52 / CDC B-1940 / NIH 8579) TaxID=1442370 RepID=A0A0D2HRC7_CLAB1|nr:uncharacterized protein Z519_06000 [Cladophialophora bantiana CBS 173.52]KIW93395.1 hypothetical protein Z519_06000 [Cladophialophora bantiana CBS 173.52]
MATARKQKGTGSRTYQASQPRRGTGRVGVTAPQHPEPGGWYLPAELQQLILDVFRRAFPFDHEQLELKSTIQEVKGHLYQRDFARAFAKPEYLDAYALRWSASRALGYTSIFLHHDLQRVWHGPAETAATAPSTNVNSVLKEAHLPRASGACNVVCIGGGGGAEVVACAAAARTLSLPSGRLAVHVVDIADWSTCLEKLEQALFTPPPLSRHVSESAKAVNKAFATSDAFSVRFTQHDILAMEEAGLLHSTLCQVHFCTIMFTLNELFSASLARTTAFLLALTDAMSPGSWLLVVDSPGSYSEVTMGSGFSAAEGRGDAKTQTRRYPMKWLVDHALLEVAGKQKDEVNSTSRWRKCVSDDSRWFRLSQQQSRRYPVELENMRYQIHLYQRIQPGDRDGEGQG